jgi:translation initiation factor 1A
MPKNKGKGGKNRRRGKNENEGLKRELVFKEDGQEYAQVSIRGSIQNTSFSS